MLTSKLDRPASHPPAGPRTLLPAMILMAVVGCARLVWAEPLYPVALINWMVEGAFHAMIVDKSEQKLSVWRIKDGEPTLLETYRCSTGESQGDKWVRGDMRTPEGVYFFCSVIDGRTLPPKYGFWAFTTDYPNFVDRRRGKSGDGIWLHGRDKPLGPKPDSNGCIALENSDLVKVSRYIRLQSTPLIVVKKLKMAPRSVILEQERELRDFIEGWRQAWESQNLDNYMKRYSRNFQSCWLDYNAWREKKRKLYERYKKIRVRIGNVYLYRQDGIVTAIFSQEYSSESYRSSGIKVLYLVREGEYRIYAEDYHKPVDDPFPVAALLARVGEGREIEPTERKEYSIRLVSTDEPDQPPAGEFETPRPSAPSKGVVLERIHVANDSPAPTLEVNEKYSGKSSVDRLIVAQIVPAYVPTESVQEFSGTRKRALLTEKSPTVVPSDEKKEMAHAALAAEPKGEVAVPASDPATAVKKRVQVGTENDLGSEGRAFNNRTEERSGVLAFLSKWKSAWEQKNLDRFIKMYHPHFESGERDYRAYVKSKKQFFRKYRTIRVKMERVQMMKVGDRLIVKFLQTFRGDDYRDKGWKRMVLAGDKSKGFRIVREEWSSL